MLRERLKSLFHLRQHKMSGLLTLFVSIGLLVLSVVPASKLLAADAVQTLEAYRKELADCRAAFGGTQPMPDTRFFLFGMGARAKLLYKAGALMESPGGKILRQWKVTSDIIVPPAYEVDLTTTDGTRVRISEDEEAVWIEEAGKKEAVEGTKHRLHLPTFSEYRYPGVLRVLHQELLINVIAGKPVPNYFVYSKPWYRDGAMMAMAFKATGNLDEIRDWVLNLDDPYDRNNKGETEADNLGEALFLISLVSDKSHPLVAKIQKEFPRFEVNGETGKYIRGRSDYSEHPVYQTKWAKFGLKALGLADEYTIPRVKDGYSALFWMEYKDTYVPGGDTSERKSYPYLGWACDHFHGKALSPLSDHDYPLTWEKNASDAKYEGMGVISGEFVKQHLSMPHTWHASEVFLYLLEGKSVRGKDESSLVPAVEISDEILHDKIRGGIIGETFGDLNGLPHEMKYIDAPGKVEHYVPSLPNGAWTDDDTDIEWVHHFYMDKTETTLLPYSRIPELWKAHVNKLIWTANDYARRLMDLGIYPPYTGRIAINPVSVFNISGEFCAESFGLCAPAMPQTASRIGLHYTHITIDGEPAQQTQLFDTMIAMAFVESDIDRLINAGVSAIDPRSELIEVIHDTRKWCAQNTDWHDTRKLIHDKYTLHHNELPDKNGYQLNTAAILAALIYGKGDYVETMRMTFNFGWDADCTSATAGTIIGTIKGGKYFDDQIAHHGWQLKDVYKNTCRDGMPMDETVTGYVDRVYRIARRVIKESGGETREVDGKLFFHIIAQSPRNVELLPKPLARLEELKTELLPAIEKDLTGSPTDQARAAYLAICLGEAPRLSRDRASDWSAALAALKMHTSLINTMYNAPPSVATEFQARFRAAGVEKSKGELIKPATQPIHQ